MHFTNKDKINSELGSETIMEHGKIRPLIQNCMIKLDFEKKIVTRSRRGYIPHTNYGKQFKMYFFLYFSGIWNSLPPNDQCKNIEEFKMYTKEQFKPKMFNTFLGGVKLETFC